LLAPMRHVYGHSIYRMEPCASTLGSIEVDATLAANRHMSVSRGGHHVIKTAARYLALADALFFQMGGLLD